MTHFQCRQCGSITAEPFGSRAMREHREHLARAHPNVYGMAALPRRIGKPIREATN